MEEKADASSKDAKEKDILQKIKMKPGKVNGGKTVSGMLIISGPGRPMMSPMPSKAKKGKGKWNKEGGKDHSQGDFANTAIASSEASETRTQSFYTSFLLYVRPPST